MTRLPVRPAEREWIDRSLDRLLATFGEKRLRGTVMLPSDDFFPGVYRGTEPEVRDVVDRVRHHMGVDAAQVDVEIYQGDDDGLLAHVPVTSRTRSAAGHHRIREGRSVVAIRADLGRRPMALVATAAHEFGHALLREPNEPLTDLLTVFCGVGVFAANAAFEHRRADGYLRTSRLGYLTVPMYGYALARYAWLRGESKPAWARYLDTNPRAFLGQGLRHLARGR
jgi:hypothetical protein